jgi:hypothetical protein
MRWLFYYANNLTEVFSLGLPATNAEQDTLVSLASAKQIWRYYNWHKIICCFILSNEFKIQNDTND